MDIDNWQGNDARFNHMVLRVFGDFIWVSADAHVASSDQCGGEAYSAAGDWDWRRLYRIYKTKLQPASFPPLLSN